MPIATEKQSSPTLKERYDAVLRRVEESAARSGRTSDDIIVVAVSKYASMDQVRELIRLGHADFGENQVQSLIQRAALVDEFLDRSRAHGGDRADVPESVRWHMVGHLQRNKVKKALQHARLVHSVDSLRLAEEIQSIAMRLDQVVEVLIQVNISGERTKTGIAPAATRHLLDQVDTMINIRPRGLMAMAPLVEDPVDARPWFERARELFDDVRRSGAGGERFEILSMGMSNDFEVAIECGANVVRVGSAIFGPRATDAEPDDD